jgi:hypothetical protein
LSGAVDRSRRSFCERNRIRVAAYCRSAPRYGADDCNNWGTIIMKTTIVLGIALGLASLAACNKSPNEQAADNIEANYENVADNMEANVDNSADAMQANTENAADAVRNVGEQKADSVRNSADADGNSAK